MATMTLDRHIEIKAGIMGGKAHIAGRRISIQKLLFGMNLLGKVPMKLHQNMT